VRKRACAIFAFVRRGSWWPAEQPEVARKTGRSGRVQRNRELRLPREAATASVNGHWEIRLGGLVFSGLAATSLSWPPSAMRAHGGDRGRGSHDRVRRLLSRKVAVDLVPDPGSTSGRPAHTHLGGGRRVRPEGGTTNGASAKAPSAAWPRRAPERPSDRHQAPRDLPEIVEDNDLPSWSCHSAGS
jgi:hypothetical protein